MKIEIQREDQCPICYEKMSESDTRTLHCGHQFHGRCVDKSVAYGLMQCSLCRSPLTTKDCAGIMARKIKNITNGILAGLIGVSITVIGITTIFVELSAYGFISADWKWMGNLLLTTFCSAVTATVWFLIDEYMNFHPNNL